MKTFSFVGVLIITILLNCEKQSQPSIIGTWELIQGKNVTADSTFIYPISKSAKHIKIITQKYCVTIWQDTTASGFWASGFNGGYYMLDKDTYTEKFDFFSEAKIIGAKVSFKIKIDKDRLYLTYQKGKRGMFEEWRRLE